MKRKLKFNLEKIDNTIFNTNKDINEFINAVENESEIEEKCKKYYQIEYPITLKRETENDETYWIAEHPDLQGCITHGYTREEALFNLDDAKKSWIFGRIVDNDSIPKPSKLKEYDDCSGKVLLRLPKKLHSELIKTAKQNDTSLNQAILFLISYALGKTSIINPDAKLQQVIQDVSLIKEMLLDQKLEQHKTLEQLWELNIQTTKSQNNLESLLSKYQTYQYQPYMLKHSQKSNVDYQDLSYYTKSQDSTSFNSWRS